jgi:hypothetical protein
MTAKTQVRACDCVSTSILDSIGNTPMIEMNLEHEQETWHFFAKMEFMNPTGSVKDRIAKYMIERAEQRGERKDETRSSAPARRTARAHSASSARRYDPVSVSLGMTFGATLTFPGRVLGFPRLRPVKSSRQAH